MLHRNANGYCDDHQADAVGWKRTQEAKGNSSQRGYGAKWQRLRKWILLRDNYLCQPCILDGRITEATEVDHRVNKAGGGDDSPENLQSICSDCHKAKTAQESAKGLHSAFRSSQQG